MGNPVTNHLPGDIDGFLQDTAQMFGVFGYTEMMEFHPTKEELEKLRDIHSKMCDTEDEDELQAYSEEVRAIVIKPKEVLDAHKSSEG